MRFVLVQPPSDRKGIVSITPPLGLPYIASVLESKQVTVSVIVSDAEGMSVDDTVDRVVASRPDVVGFSIGTLVALNSYRIASFVKEKIDNVVLIAGGPHATALPQDVLENGIDFVVIGEGERTIADFVDYLLNKKDLDDVDGIAYRRNGTTLYNKPRVLIDHLDELPLPAWHLFPIDKYKSEFKKTNRTLPIMTSRGCPGRCVFCYKGLFGNRYRTRSPQNILREILHLKSEFNITSFDIIDDSFTAGRKRALEVCRLIKENGVELGWGLPSGIRVDTVSEELMTALKEAGCYRIGFGVESGNDQILKAIGKNTTKDQIRRAVDLAKRMRFETSCFFIIGNLGETRQTIDDTIAFARELDPDVAQFTMAIPYPGTEMFDLLSSQNRILSHDWNDYDYFKSGHQIFEHENLEFDVIHRKLDEAYKRFYFRPKFMMRAILAIDDFEKLVKLLKAFFRLIKILK